MVTHTLSADSQTVLLLGVLLLLWFYTIWQSFVVEGTRSRLAGLKEIWHETVALDPAWRHCPEVRTVDNLLDANHERIARLSLTFLLTATLVSSRARRIARVQVYERLSRLPSSRLQREAVSIVETATRYVALAALKRSLLAWTLAPLWLAAFIVWSIHWQFLIVLLGAPQAWLQHARVRLRRKMLGPLVTIVTSLAPRPDGEAEAR
jgi:hypothetical protein